MIDFIINIFSTDGFIPKAMCGKAWTKDLVISAQIANIIITIGYYLTSIQMFQLFHKKRREVPITRQTTFILMICFPMVCGLSRIAAITVYKWPAYRFYILLDWLCAISVSILAYRLRNATEYLINLPSHSQQMKINQLLSDEVKRRKKTQEEVETMNKRLIMVVERLEAMIKSEIWLHDKRTTLEELNKMLEEIQKEL